MSAVNNPPQFGKWLVERALGEGAQGTVYLVRALDREQVEELSTGFASYFEKRRDGYVDPRTFTLQLLSAFSYFERMGPGALKHLHSPERAKNALAAPDRFKREVQLLSGVSHPGLVKLLDQDTEGNWYVMEYHARGPITRQRERFVGNLQRTLLAIRPLVAALAEIHRGGWTHRDLKPENVFLTDRDELVLGDPGLAFADGADSEARLTGTYENAGSRDWMPTWAQGARLEKVTPDFDTFAAGKLIWWMLSGRSFLRLHYFHKPEFDLEKIHPDIREMRAANKLLSKCLVEDQGAGLPDGGALLKEIDTVLESIPPGRPADYGRLEPPQRLFPGKWLLDSRRVDGGGNQEQFTVDANGDYVVEGRLLRFRTKLYIASDSEALFIKRAPQDGQEYREVLQYNYPQLRFGIDQFGTRLVYKSTS